MSKGGSGYFTGTFGSKSETNEKTKAESAKKPKIALFSNTGHVSKKVFQQTENSFAENQLNK